jgi:hypothetical protein
MMPRADNRLNGARNLNVLGVATVSQSDKFKPKDIETLYRFRLMGSGRWDATLSGLAKKANADVELYRFNCRGSCDRPEFCRSDQLRLLC